MKSTNHHIKQVSQHLSEEELLNYSRGMLSTDEMHRVERHLLECEFCSDAVEGVEGRDTVKIALHLDALRDRIGGHVSEKEAKQSYPWIGIAASALLVIASAVGFLVLRSGSDELPVVEKQAEQEDLLAYEEPIAEDTIGTTMAFAQEEASETVSPSDAGQPVTSPEQPAPSPEVFATPATRGPVDTALTQAEDTPPAVSNNNLALAEETEQRKPLMSEEIVEEAADTELVLEEVATIAAEDDDALARATTAEELKEDKATFYADQEPGAQNLKESEAEGFKPATAPSLASKKAAASELSELPEATPQGGLVAFNQHVKENLKYPETALGNGTDGSVILTFQIQEDGKPININVEKGLGDGCDEEAKRLLMSGPLWFPPNAEGRATIQFMLPKE